MNQIIQNLNNIETWLDDNWPPPSDFNSDDEFMTFAVEIMNRMSVLA